MDDDLAKGGIVGILVILILKEVFRFLSDRKSPPARSPLDADRGEIKCLLSDLQRKSEKLLAGMEFLIKWHEKEDPGSGQPRAYYPHAQMIDLVASVTAIKREIENIRQMLSKEA